MAETYIEDNFENKVKQCYNLMKDVIRNEGIEARDDLDILFGSRFEKREMYSARLLLMKDEDIYIASVNINGRPCTLYKYGDNFTPEEKEQYVKDQEKGS